MAYQICFDLYESASQQFLSSVIQNLRTVGTPIPAVPGSTNTGTVPAPDKDRCAGENAKKKKSIVVRSCFTQKCFVFLIWQWCNGDRWQSWQLTCWKVSRNGKMKSAIELFFNFFFLYPNGENIFSFSFLSWYRKMSPKTRMPRWSKSSVERWPSSCTCSSWSEITTQI